MARKKTKRVQVKKVYRPKLDTSFSCPFCNEDNSVDCKLDRAKQTGTARCRSCHAGYQTIINYLSEPIDVFAEWVDAIDDQRRQRISRRDPKNERELSPDRRSRTSASPDQGRERETDEDKESDGERDSRRHRDEEDDFKE